MNHAWKRLQVEGVDVWIDMAASAQDTAREVRRALGQGEVSGVRTGPARSADELRQSCDLLRPLHRASGGVRGLVSVPLPAPPAPASPGAAEWWVARARELREAVGRPNLVVRLSVDAADPATLRGLFALGTPLEVAGVRSVGQYERAATALLAALDGATRVASFISFDVAGVDHPVDARLDLIGSDEAKALRGRAGLAAARLAHREHDVVFSSARWGALAAAGAPEPRLLWLTGGFPLYRAAHVTQELVTRGTVTAMTLAAGRALEESGTICGDRVWRHYADAERTLAYLDWFGISVESLARRTLRVPGTPAPPAPPAAPEPPGVAPAESRLPPGRTGHTAQGASTAARRPGSRRPLAPA
ncbi:transaldolase [Streptomyces albidoflavus]